LEKGVYTRNLVHRGNGKFNLILVMWDSGNPRSPIHDHSGSHCFVKVLDGTMREVKII
jgi:cysteine dioxygenase